jgi:hypothetical protein
MDWSPPPDDDGDVLVILADGKGAPTISSTELARRREKHKRKKSGRAGQKERRQRQQSNKPRREPGDRSKNAKMAAVGVIYTMRKNGDSLEGPINKRVYGTFVSYRALFEWLLKEATKRGLGTDRITKVLFIADGAEILWDLQREFFPQVHMCLDWYHIVERIWLVGRALFRSDRKSLETWVSLQKSRLRHGQLNEVLDAFRRGLNVTSKTGPGNKERRVSIEKTLAHFEKNMERMQYQSLREQGLPIGSGAVEGAVRHLVGMRQDGPGMRWGRERMEAILLLRCIVINQQWDDFSNYLANQTRLSLPSEPILARPHDAKQKKAA